MPRARRRIVSLEATPYYHCISRCVRQAFLCGFDKSSGRSFEHRRQWVVDRLAVLQSVFCIDVCAYAVMSNHLHVVIHCDRDRARDIPDASLLSRLERIWKVPTMVREHVSGTKHTDQASHWLAERRERLCSVSWFMACLNEWLARRANREDECTGRFWEGRFKSQALLTEKALLTCMAYVDLNPVRASAARGLADSDFTSIQARLLGDRTIELMPFRDQSKEGLPITGPDYFELVEWTGRSAVPGKKGQITDRAHCTLKRLGHDEASWRMGMRLFGSRWYAVIGPLDGIRRFASVVGRKWMHGLKENEAVFRPS